VNFVTCHDGFTLHDLVSYEDKHNEANLEENRDGSSHNLSRNWGPEGPTDAPHVIRMRERIKRNFLATLAFSQGVPMISHGDELGRTQLGNNNAYCHDSTLTWVDWETTPAQQELLQFTREIFAIRAAAPLLRRANFFSPEPDLHSGVKELTWLTPEGKEMSDSDWRDPGNHILGMLMRGGDRSPDGSRSKTEVLLLLLNAGGRSRDFTLPSLAQAGRWMEIVHTAHPVSRAPREGHVALGARCLILLQYQSEPR
jgi:glycogen operon protein